MSALIDTLIPQQNFELILNRIGEILTVEKERQILLGNYDLDDVQIYKERSVPFMQSELACVNVSLFSGEFQEETQMQTQGFYRYIIEVLTNAKSEDVSDDNDGRGDRISAIRMMRILGIIRAILMDARYMTLGFARPSVGHRKIERMFFMGPPHQDANTSRQGRIELLVKIPETPASFVTPVDLAEHFTRVTLNDTEKGYIWVYEAP
jgi:hypothetical protein